MAVDYAKLTNDLKEFYDFANKVVLYVGVGGRPLLDFTTKAKRVIAIDKNPSAIQGLDKIIAMNGVNNSVGMIPSRFEDVEVPGDVVYFEFCLHEMVDPAGALRHAHSLAPEVVVFDHSPDSPWMYYAAEEDCVQRSAEAMECFGIRQHRKYQTEQRFKDCGELFIKFAAQSPLAFERSRQFYDAMDFAIPMDYELNLL